MKQPIVTAHNGAGGTPVDSLQYIEYALQSSADAIEIDVQPGADGTLVFAHDHPLPNIIYPSVREVFAMIRGTGRLINCDLKTPGLETAVYRLAEACGVSAQLIYSGSVDASRCLESHLNTHVEILLNIEAYIPDLYQRCIKNPGQIEQSAREICSICKSFHLNHVNAYYKLATEPFRSILSEEGILLSVWTIDDPQEALPFLRDSVYNITTREPELLRKTLHEAR